MSMLLRRRLAACFCSFALGLFTTLWREGEPEPYKHRVRGQGNAILCCVDMFLAWLLAFCSFAMALLNIHCGEGSRLRSIGSKGYVPRKTDEPRRFHSQGPDCDGTHCWACARSSPRVGDQGGWGGRLGGLQNVRMSTC